MLEICCGVLLIHLIDGISLRHTLVIARQLGFSDVSDLSLLMRLNASGERYSRMQAINSY